MAEQIKHTDIAEVGVMKPLQDELIATIQIINTMDADLVAIAKSLKKALSDGTTTSTEGLKRLTEQAKQAKEAMSLKEIQTKQMIQTESKLAASLTDEAKQLAELNLKLQEQNRELKENAKLTSDQVGAYDKADIKLKNMIKTWKNLAIVQKENTVEGKALKVQIDQLDMTLKSVDASMGQHRRNVGNYASGFNGLNNSINQLTREMPAFVNSAQTGFMAISNNLPMLVDQIGLLSQKNKELNAEGIKGVPIWKSVASALFSWQTLMGVGITLMVTYGKEIGNYIMGLFGINKKTEEQIALEKKIQEKREASIADMSKQVVSIETLRKVIEDETNSNKIKIQAYTDLQKLIPELTNLTYTQAISENNLSDAISRQLILINLKADLEIYNEELVAQRTAKYKKQKVEDAQKIIDLNKELLELNKRDLLSRVNSQVIFTLFDKERIESIKEEIKFLKMDVSEKAALVQAQISDIERLGKSKADLIKQEEKDAKKSRAERIKDYEQKLKELEELSKLSTNTKNKLETELLKAYISQKKAQDALLPQIINTDKLLLDAQNKLFEQGTKNRKQKSKDDAKQEADLLRSSTNILENTSKRQLQIINSKIDRELQANQKRQDDLRNLSLKGVQDANNNLAFEERKQAELEAKRIKAQKNQKKQEILFAGLKAYASNVEKNPNTALLTTLKDITLLTSALSSLPTFIEGTENIAKSLGKPQLSGKDGYVVRVDGDERVINPSDNKIIGNMTNEELTSLADMKNKGLLSVANFGIPMSNLVNDNLLINETAKMNKNLEDVKNLLKNMPNQIIQYDEITKISTEIIKSGYKTTSTSKKIGGLRG